MKRLLLVATLAGCLQVPHGPGSECSVDSDCNTAAGEVCEEGVCYGDPPTGLFAATLIAPIEREDLTSTEFPNLEIPRDGQLGDLQLEVPVKFSGRVEAYCAGSNCSTMSIGAEVRVSRPSRFPGGPTLRLSAPSKAGIPRGMDSFSILIPRTHDGDPPWTVTIDPNGGGEQPAANGTTDPAELVPPKRIELRATNNLEHETYTLGGTGNAVISGTLKDSLGNYLSGYRIVALGRLDQSSALTEVSTVDYVTNGQYQLMLSENAQPPIEIVARPFGPNVVAPELHISGLAPISQQRNLAQPTGLGSRVDVTITIKGLAGDGVVKPVPGARVIITGSQEAAFSGAAGAFMQVEAITGENGDAKLTLLDGAQLSATYRLRVVPPASSNLGVVYDANLALEAGTMSMQLPSRVGIKGRVLDIHGNPLPDVSVTARRSLRFLWSLDASNQSFLDEIPASTTTTPESGDFNVWVDPAIADAWGGYDVTFETPKGSPSPNWVIPDVEIPRMASQTAIQLGDVTIPDAAHIRAKIVDLAGNPVEGSALRIYQLPTDNLLCMQASHAPEDCHVDARVLGNDESDGQGIVRLELARP
jgi:hypothetical protein